MVDALHRVRFSYSDGTSIDIECVNGHGAPETLAGMPADVEYIEKEMEPEAVNVNGVPSLCYRASAPILFEPFQLREHTDYYIDITLPMSWTVARAAAEGSKAWPFADRIGRVFSPDPPRRWRSTDTGSVVVTGILKVGENAGILDLRLGQGVGRLVEVVCAKLEFITDFYDLLDRVAEEILELLLQFDSPTSARFSSTDATQTHDAFLLFHLRHIMMPDNLPTSIEEILSRPHERMYRVRQFVGLEDVEEPDVHELAAGEGTESLRAGGPLNRYFRGYTPETIPVHEVFESRDTPENRYVKQFLEELSAISDRLQVDLASAGKFGSSREAGEWKIQLQELLSRNFWADVGEFRQFPSNSQVLQKTQGYRDVLKHDTSMRLGLQLEWDRGRDLANGLIGDLRPVSELYEYWCFFVLRNILLSLCEREDPINGTLLNVSTNGLRVSLQKGRRSKTSFVYRYDKHREVTVNLFYNRRFSRPNRNMESWSGSYTSSFHPDYSLEVVVNGNHSPQRHWLHFDAKYRLTSKTFASLFSGDGENPIGEPNDSLDEYKYEMDRMYRREDLFKMHTYRDGILGSRGAYIIYPGDDSALLFEGDGKNIFVRHPSALGCIPEHSIPSVGAFCLSPTNETAQRDAITSFLKGFIDNVCQNNTYGEEDGFFGD